MQPLPNTLGRRTDSALFPSVGGSQLRTGRPLAAAYRAVRAHPARAQVWRRGSTRARRGCRPEASGALDRARQPGHCKQCREEPSGETATGGYCVATAGLGGRRSNVSRQAPSPYYRTVPSRALATVQHASWLPARMARQSHRRLQRVGIQCPHRHNRKRSTK